MKTITKEAQEAQLHLNLHGEGDVEATLNLCGDELSFFFSRVLGDPLSKLPDALYCAHPHNSTMPEPFCWEDSFSYSDWYFYPCILSESDLYLRFAVEQSDYSGSLLRHEYTIPYRAMCHAVSCAFTALLKQHGFTGYRDLAKDDCLDLTQLLFLKSHALDERIRKDFTGSLSAELCLLLLDL